MKIHEPTVTRLHELGERLNLYARAGGDLKSTLTNLTLDVEAITMVSVERAVRVMEKAARRHAQDPERSEGEAASLTEVGLMLSTAWLDGFVMGYISGSGEFSFLPEVAE